MWQGHIEIIRILLEFNADPNLVDEEGKGPLHTAAYFGSYGHQVKGIRRKDPPSTLGEDCKAPATHRDAQQESVRLDILRLLLESKRCTVDLRESHGCTPLWYAAGGGWTRAAEMLLAAGASVDPAEKEFPDQQGLVSPLIHALNRGQYETAKMLLIHGARAPTSGDIEALCCMNRFPAGLLDSLLEAAAEQAKEAAASAGAPASARSLAANGYEMGTRCDPVPLDAFAQAPSLDKNAMNP